MNRRALLKGMLALPAAGVLGETVHGLAKEPAASDRKLAVILQGPFAVVIQKNKDCRVNAFVPKTDPDDLQHEFRFPSPQSLVNDCGAGYRFELLRDGLHASCQDHPHVDRGHDDICFPVEEWTPHYDEYFVSLELPAPDAISYVPPLHPASFGNEGRIGYVPLNQILEYRVQSAANVLLRAKPPAPCRRKAQQGVLGYSPMTSDRLKAEYEAHYQKVPDQAGDLAFSQRRYILQLLSRYDYLFFIGVGARVEMDPLSHMRERMVHGVNFFNTKLLPAIIQHDKLEHKYHDRLLRKVGREALPCGPEQLPSPKLTSAVWRPNQGLPHLQYVASNENCSAPPAIATALR